MKTTPAPPWRCLLRGLCAALLAWAASPAQALCLQPLCSCSITTSAIVFGAYNPLAGSHVDSTGNVRVSCGGVAGLLIPYNLALGPGGGSHANRRMSSGAGTLDYNLYTGAGMASIWGDGNAATQLVASSMLLDVLGLAPAHNHTVYGRIPMGQTSVRPGLYGDTITVTLTYF